MTFYDNQRDEVCSDFTVPDVYQSYPGIVHGGIVASMLDEVVGRVAMIDDHHHFMMSVKLEVKYRHPVPTETPLRIVGRIVKLRGRLGKAVGEIRLPDGAIAAESAMTLADVPAEMLVGVDLDTLRQFRQIFRLRSRAVALLASLLVLSMLVAACGRRDNEPLFALGTDDVTLQGEATLVCGEDCRGSGQCGTIGPQWVILASSGGPSTEAHDLTFPDRAPVTILANQMEVVQSVADPSRSQRVPFYAVQMGDQAAGWVAGWCIGQLIVP